MEGETQRKEGNQPKSFRDLGSLISVVIQKVKSSKYYFYPSIAFFIF
jgi:hypothetical protein